MENNIWNTIKDANYNDSCFDLETKKDLAKLLHKLSSTKKVCPDVPVPNFEDESDSDQG